MEDASHYLRCRTTFVRARQTCRDCHVPMANLFNKTKRSRHYTIKRDNTVITNNVILWLSCSQTLSFKTSLKQLTNSNGKTLAHSIRQPWSPSRLAAMVGRRRLRQLDHPGQRLQCLQLPLDVPEPVIPSKSHSLFRWWPAGSSSKRNKGLSLRILGWLEILQVF